jgi:hypothetical protein
MSMLNNSNVERTFFCIDTSVLRLDMMFDKAVNEGATVK